MRYYLSLGSNIGDREQTIRQAIRLMEQKIGTIPCCSSFYYSAPWGFDSENGFCNVCCLLETTMPPLEVLAATQAIERALGRTRKSVNGQYSDRTIDIDLIQAFDEQGKEIVLQITNTLILPHPLWEKRDFVRIPLQELRNK